MSENKSGPGVPFNLTTVVALFTLLGGLWVASKSVNSDRPNSPANTPFQSIGYQTLQARLWEDPLDWQTNQSQAFGSNSFDLLRGQITLSSDTTNRPFLLPVMMEGGPYSEDREKRIRSRYAIISALGESGYVPEDENHVGAVTISWPTTMEMSGWLTNQASALRWRPDSFPTAAAGTTNDPDDNSPGNGSPASGILRIGFEWYRSRIFSSGNRPPPGQRLLVLWLDEDQFDDCPPARLALLLNELASGYAQPANSNTCPALNGLFAKVDLIGPRTSTTLRALLPDYGTTNFDSRIICTDLQAKIKTILGPVDVFCPTPSAMDAVLVKNCANALPRRPVEHVLTNSWFHSFHNFSATDSQLAGEALDELRLRKIDLANTNKNLVLISEWDTFYGRMLSLTYAAELARFQGVVSNDVEFVTNYLAGSAEVPANLHCFVYLRGLDGQTTQPGPSGSADTNGLESSSLENLVAGDPNESKAEGEAQFDYMNRLADRMKKLEDALKRKGHNQIDAVGICGSDPYDTLVILQVLRPDFPNAVFFTTDLDARFAHPKEQDWARNLVVLSSYGLQLDGELQGSVAPFRDSDQTAQFAATLAALGNTNFDRLSVIPPRRFEIGRDQAFDLSLSDGGFLHPRPSVGYSDWGTTPATMLLVVVSGAFLLFCSSRRLQRLTWDATQHEIKCLWFGPEDVGDRPGVASLRQLGKLASERGDPLSNWLWNSFFDWNGRVFSGPEASPAELQAFLDFLNQVVLQNGLPLENVLDSPNITPETKEQFRQMSREKQSQGTFFARNSVRQMRFNRKLLGELFSHILTTDSPALSKDEHEDLKELAKATNYARLAGEQQYLLRRHQRWSSWIGLLLFIVLLGLLLIAAQRASLPGSGGEPLLFFAGISVWPTTLLRLIAIGLAVFFLGRSYDSLRTGILTLSRSYRLPLVAKATGFFKWRLPSTPPPGAAVDAATIWERYQQLGRFWQRLFRVLPPFAAYVAFCCGLAGWIGDLPYYTPARGLASFAWSNVVLLVAVFISLFLAFWIIDAACLCRWFIERFSESPTRYPKSCLRFFAKQRGLEPRPDARAGKTALPVKPDTDQGQGPAVAERDADENESILAEWIDMQLIAELTRRVGQLVYFPFIVFFVLIVSRNNVFDRWSWPVSLVVIFSLNLSLCVASMVILRNAALKARDTSLENLRARVAAVQQEAAANPKANQAAVGQRLLKELETLDKGAFAPLWDNPLVGAILIPSGGSVLIEVLSHVFHS